MGKKLLTDFFALSYRLKFIYSTRFTASSLSNLACNLAEGMHNSCKYAHDNKNCKTCRIILKDCECCLGYTNFENSLIECKCLCCNKSYEKFFY